MKARKKNGALIFGAFFYFMLTNNMLCSEKTVDEFNFSQIGFEKYASTYRFFGAGLFSTESFGGVFSLEENYSGAALSSSGESFRDRQNLNASFLKPFSKSWSFSAYQSWILNSDIKDVELNKLERVGLGAGLKFAPKTNWRFAFQAGGERNRQLGLTSFGPSMRFTGDIRGEKIVDFDINAKIDAEYLSLNRDRLQTGMKIDVGATNRAGENQELKIDAFFENSAKDYLSGVRGFELDELSVERRNFSSYGAKAYFKYPFFDELLADLNFSLGQSEIDKFYHNFYTGAEATGVRRSLNRFETAAEASLAYKNKKISERLALSFKVDTEDNLVSAEFPEVDESVVEQRRRQEDLRDSESSRTTLSSITNIYLSSTDRIASNFSASILRYDTPSEKNYDDRDELTILLDLNYIRDFSEITRLKLSFYGYANRLVFLKKQRSSMNNWNRIIRFSPSVEIKTKRFSMNPRFEALANYTVYDYEENSPAARSYSFREISYKDSIYYEFYQSCNIFAKIDVRCYERGILYWDSFSEYPQNGAFNCFVKSLVGFQSDGAYFGAGARYFVLNRENFAKKSTSGNYRQEIIGPEAALQWRFESGSSVEARAWYEFQTANDNEKAQIPNVFLKTKIVF